MITETRGENANLPAKKVHCNQHDKGNPLGVKRKRASTFNWMQETWHTVQPTMTPKLIEKRQYIDK